MGKPLKKEKKKLKIVSKPEEYFKQEVTRALQNQKIKTDLNTESYLVHLLTKFINAENFFKRDEDGKVKQEVLALLLGETLVKDTVQKKMAGLQRLGDVSLYTAGFFSDSLSRKIVDIDYYIGMGRTAYSSLASQQAFDKQLQAVFYELSRLFHKFVDVLAEVSEASGASANAQNVLRLYEIWLKTHSQWAEKQLKKMGITPNSDVKARWLKSRWQ